MANGTYGTKRPAQITPNDVDIFYYYRPSYSSESEDFANFKKLDSSRILSAASGEYGSEVLTLPGMYNLRLPLNEFGQRGVYTIYIKPKEIFTTIIDGDARLAAMSNIRGIILDASDIADADISNNGNLVGYRVEYFDDNKVDRLNEYRIITSNNKCEPVAQNFNDTSQKGIRYRFNDSSNLLFCTLTPSSSLSFKSNSLPGIGSTGQRIALINTKFNPIALEIEMVEHDAETISTMLEGAQLRDLDNGTITTFDRNGAIYHQAKYGNIINPSKGIHYDFKLPKTDNIDYTVENELSEVEESAL